MMDNLTRATVYHMARRTETILSDRHWRVLEYAHAYHACHQVGPLYRNIERNTGVGRDELGRLFPHGLQSIYGWVGIPIQTTDMPCKPAAHVKVEQYREVFLDHNATTYLRKDVRAALHEFLDDPEAFANPSSSSTAAPKVHRVIEQARSRVARCLDVSPDEILFTGSGTEAINLAIKGLAFRHLSSPGHLITSVTEHSVVLQTMQFWQPPRLGSATSSPSLSVHQSSRSSSMGPLAARLPYRPAPPKSRGSRNSTLRAS